MSDQSEEAGSPDPRVQAALREYLERVDRGEVVNRDEFLMRHIEIAAALRSFFAAEEPLRKLAANKVPGENAGISTNSIAAQGQETVPPGWAPGSSPGTTGSGLAGQFGRYQILRALGKGAMGAVYLAQDTQLKRPVAIKTPHFEEDPTGELLQRFYREAQAAATLRHANICPVYDVGQIDGRHFISMAYIEGRPLSDVIHGGKPQHERQIVIAVHKLTRALQQAHDRGIVHRDLKPANIMVDQQGEPIIMDFGLARQTRRDGDASLTQSGMILGSPAYMSPEQVEGDPESVGPASDQYSLGVALYEMLTGQLPFRGSVVNVLAQIIAKNPTPPGELRAGLDPRIEAVCLRMMAKKAADRFPSMKAVADQLAAIVKHPSSTSVPAPNAAEKSPTANRSAAAPRLTSDGESQIGQSLNQRSISPSDVASIEELVRKCLGRRDYDQMIPIIEQIPEERRNTALRTLLEQARQKVDEIAFLICEIDEADRLKDRQTALRKAEELLKIKPGHQRAQQILEKYSGDVKGVAVRIAPLRQFTKPWREGGWIPWSVLACGLAAFAAIYGVVVFYVGRTAIVVDIKDPGVEVAMKGTTLNVTGPDKQTVKVEPGDQELTITGAGLVAVTKNFSLKKGDKQTVTVSIVNREIVARLDNENVPLPSAPEKKTPSPDPIGKGAGPSLAPPSKGATPAAFPPTFKNRLSMEFVLVPKGKSWLGGGKGRPGEQEVVIAQDFYLGKYEVTQGEWAAVTGGNPSRFSHEGVRSDTVRTVTDAQLERFPVENVSWNDAQRFLELVNRKAGETGWVYRLPTEVEWEYACRGGPMQDKSESSYSFYLDKPTNHVSADQANFKGDHGLNRTCQVGSYQPNRLGLFDMHGNVFELCDAVENASVGDSSPAATRGGGWSNVAGHCTASFRSIQPPSHRAGSWSPGLRVARVPVRTTPTRDEDPDRRAAAWVLSIGGRPGIESDGEERDVDRLPPGPFKLRKVRFYGNQQISDAGLASFRGCRNLQELNLYAASKYSDTGLANFKDSTDLRVLYLSGDQVSDAGLANFKHCKSLTEFGLASMKASDQGLSSFKNCKNLAALELRQLAKVSDAGVAPFLDCTNLKLLNLYGTGVTDAALAHVGRLVNLEFLNVAYTSKEVTDASLQRLQNLPRLKELYLNGTQVTNGGLAHLEGLAQLETLEIDGTRIRGSGLNHLRNLLRLKNLQLGNSEVLDSDLAHLRSLTALERLGLNGTRVSGPGLAHLKAVSQLHDLNLTDSRMTNSGLEYLKHLPQLAKLHLRGTQVTDAGLHQLEGLTNLDEIDLTDTKVTAAGVEKLRKSLPACKILANPKAP